MLRTKLHIVAFDIPYPPDYGGAIDVFHKIRSLAGAGVEIYLHCPVYGDRQPSKTLETLCAKVWYYPRKTGIYGISFSLPYMVASRRHPELLRNLLSVDAPILFDGVSTSYYLAHPQLKDRIKILRNQNVEADYYEQLGQRENNILKKGYYFIESVLLKRYERRLTTVDAFFTVALHDHDHFKALYPSAIHEYIPSFQPFDVVETELGLGQFCLYHGNLALAENRQAVLFLLKEVIPFMGVRFVIAGRNPDEELKELISRQEHCELVVNPTMEGMDQLVKDAHIHVLPTFQNTGLKLKLLHALFRGRHVLVNEAMVHGTGLDSLCTVCKSGREFPKAIETLMLQEFTEELKNKRSETLSRHYSNRKNADRIIRYLQQTLP